MGRVAQYKVNMRFILFLSLLVAASTGAYISGQTSGKNLVNRELPQNFTAMTWQDVADSYLCSSDGDPTAIEEALKTFEGNDQIQWYVTTG